MLGVGISIWNDIISKDDYSTKPDIFNVLCHLIESICRFTEDEFFLVVRDNDSLDYRFNKFNVTLDRLFPHVNSYFYVDTVKSLTRGWHQIIDLSLANGCNAVILINQDVIVTKYWNTFCQAVQIPSNNLITPVMTSASYQPLQEMTEEEFEPYDMFLEVPEIQGCCIGASRKAFEDNKFSVDQYFDERFPFTHNEIEWQHRNKGKSLILLNSYVIHLENYSWADQSKIPENVTLEKQCRQNILNVVDYPKYIGV